MSALVAVVVTGGSSPEPGKLCALVTEALGVTDRRGGQIVERVRDHGSEVVFAGSHAAAARLAESLRRRGVEVTCEQRGKVADPPEVKVRKIPRRRFNG